jgi:hypothetical protein
MSLYEMRRAAGEVFRRSRIREAMKYQRCPTCGANPGDPCRTPSWRVAELHKARKTDRTSA